MTKFIILLFAFVIFAFKPNKLYSQINKIIEAKVSFEMDNKLVDINDGFEIYFVDDKDTIRPNIKQDTIVINTYLFKDSLNVIMIFRYKKYYLEYFKTSTDYIKNNNHYKFWYDKKPFSKAHSLGVNKFKTKYLYGLDYGGEGDGSTSRIAVEYKIFHIF
jgi:hypothetical protein